MATSPIVVGTGSPSTIALSTDTRKIMIAEGIDNHQADNDLRTDKTPTGHGLGHFSRLQSELGSDFVVASDGFTAEYFSSAQDVTYQLTLVQKKSDFVTALQTDGAIVIYAGHSRVGKGACFDPATDVANQEGDQWEDGDTDTGLFRMGYKYVPVPMDDMEHHKYHFNLLPVEKGPAPKKSWTHPREYHPDALDFTIGKITLSDELDNLVKDGCKSTSKTYYGFKKGGKPQLLHVADWQGTEQQNIGDITISCKTFCHFGCSSKTHYWNIVRMNEYKAWQRDKPPTTNFAYFSTAPVPFVQMAYWCLYLLKYDKPNTSDTHWFDSHQWAKTMANRRLNAEGGGWNIY